MSDPLRVKGTLYKGAGAGRILCVDGDFDLGCFVALKITAPKSGELQRIICQLSLRLVHF